MSKRVFCDQNQNVYIKIARSPEAARRELLGGKILGSYVLVPEMELLDEKTVLISKVSGVKSAQVDERKLNDLLIDYFTDLPAVAVTSVAQTILGALADIRAVVESSGLLDSVERRLFTAPLYPVHGDLQKQNIFVDDKDLAFIDFEHFLLAPLELELVNSLFFADGNCLDLENLLPRLCEKRLVEPGMLEAMLAFYAVRQVAFGRGLAQSERRFSAGLARLQRIMKREIVANVGLGLFLPASFSPSSCRE